MSKSNSAGSPVAPLVLSGTPIAGTDAQSYIASDGSMQEVVPTEGGSGGGGGPVAWDDVTNKPATFPPTIGTTPGTAKGGEYVPDWTEVANKPTTFAPIIGTTATTAKAGNYAPAWGEVTAKPAVIAAGASQADAIAAIGAIPTSQKGVANGVAPLDNAGLVPLEHLNVSGLSFKGAWNPTTNTPTLVDGTGSTGDFYKASADGSFNFGNGTYSFVEGDWVMFAAGVWQRLGSKETVASVNGKMGTVVLNAADVGARPSSYVPAWGEVTGKPTTFAPIIGTTAATAKAGNYVPAWGEITGKPTLRGAISSPIPAIYAWFLGDQSSPNSTDVTINWTNSAYDPFSMLSGGNFVVPSWATHFRATIFVQFSPNASGFRYAALHRDGAVWFAMRQPSIGATSGTTVNLVTSIRAVTAGSILSVSTWQNSGANLAINPQSWIQLELFSAQ